MPRDRVGASLVGGLAMIVSVLASADVPGALPSLHIGSSAARVFARTVATRGEDGGFVAVSPMPSPSPLTATSAPPDPTLAIPTRAPDPPLPRPRATPVPAPTRVLALGCPSDWLCYPRLGIRGPIVPYSDCFGTTDIGTDIRAFTCLSPRYLMGHAYTQMGRITGWQAGDVVFAYGQAFAVSGAVTTRSCDPPLLPLAPLSMQTSLSTSTCGPVLVVQAR